jgi:4-amino-4-deoxy-L-arabinose transferase-like glycosyltransferase
MSPRQSIISVFVLTCVFYLSFLGSRGLSEPDEGRFAAVALEMRNSGDWLMPRLNGVEHLQKPPMVYWCTSSFIRFFGRHEWAVRMTSALAAIGTVALTMWMAGVLFGNTAGWMSGVILASSGLFFVLGRVITTDMLLTFWITSAISALVAYVECGFRPARILFFIAMGLGFLTKGPLALVIPSLAAVSWKYSRKKSGGQTPQLGWWNGLPLAMLIGLSWFVFLIIRHPTLLNYFYEYEFIDRIATDVHKRHGPIWYYGPILAAGLLPWSIFIPAVIRKSWLTFRSGDGRSGLFFGWLIAPVLILSMVNSKLPTYMLPMFPPAAMVIAAWSASRIASRHRAAGVAVISLVMGFGLLMLPVIISRLEELNGSPMVFSLIFWVGVLISMTMFAVTFTLVLRGASWPRLMVCMSGAVVFSLLVLSTQADNFMMGGNASVRVLTEKIKTLSAEFDSPPEVYSIGVRAHGLEFYLNRTINRTLHSSDVVLPLNELQGKHIIQEDDVDQLIRDRSSGAAFLVIKKNRYMREPLYRDWKIVAEAGRTVLAVSPGFPN